PPHPSPNLYPYTTLFRSEQGQITQRRSAMSLSLNGKRVALLVTDGFEQVEMTEPKKALEQAGARAEILSAEPGEVRGWHHDKPRSEEHTSELQSRENLVC